MNEIIEVFNSVEFGSIRTAKINNDIYFVGKDVADALGYVDTNKAVSMHVDDEDKKLNDKTSPSFGQRGATLINESGLYSLVLSSKLESAKRFKRWITHDVLPALRRTGSYSLNIPQTLPEALRAYADEVEQHNKTKALVIDTIYEFYNNPQNIKDFEEWKERKQKHDDTQTKSAGKAS